MAEALRETQARRSAAAAGAARPARLADRPPADGTIYMRSPHPLGAYPDKLTERLEHWADAAPDRIFLAQRTRRGEWRKLTYAQTLAQVRGIAQALLARELSPERPIAILSGNDIEHALLALAAMYVGVPYAPISPAYSLMSSDFGKLKSIIELLTPGLVFAADGKAFARAIEAAVPRDVEIVVAANPPAQPRRPPVRRTAGDRADRARSMPRTPRSAPTRSRRSCSPRARPACRRA